MIEIKRYNPTSQQDVTVFTFQDIPEGAIIHRELMADHYIKLPFSLEEPFYFKIGDWCFIEGYGRFELTESYSPKYNGETGGYDYDLQLEAYYMRWKNRICKYNPTGGNKEASFRLTANIQTHLSVILDNINSLGFLYDGYSFAATVDVNHVDVTAAKFKQYESTDIISALDDLAKIYDCEWWVEDNIIMFGRLELEGTAIQLTEDVNVASISGSQSKKEFANRIYAFGSTRNIPKNYRQGIGEDITQHGIVQKRLMLPLTGEHACPHGYIQDGDIPESEIVEAVMIDDDVYPKTNCHVSRIETYTKTYKDEETNQQVTQTFYRLYDDSGFRFSTDYILEGETLHILFVSGCMSGMDFECQYNDNKKYYEVVVNDNYGRELPDTDLHPSVGDYFVIYGWDSTKMASTGLIADAELELYQSAVKKLAKLKTDPNVYTCKMDSEWYERERRVSGVSYAHFDLGQKVLLNSRAVSVEGRESRIIGFEFKLDIPYDSPEYIVGEAIAYSRSSDMQSQIDAITVNGSSYHVTGSGGGSGIFVISSTSKVQSSDTNVYSAKRTDFDFLHKREPDEAKEEIGFVKGLWVKMKGLFTFTENGDLTARTLKATGSSGSTIADIDNTTRKNLGLEVVESGIIGGVLRVAKSILTKTIQSMNFTGGDSMFGTGWQLTDNDGNGNSRLVVDNLIVRMKAVFNELEVRKFVAMAGNYVFSPAASIIEEVDYIMQEKDIETGDVIGEEVLGYTYVKVPWVLRLVPLSLVGKMLSKKKLVRTTISASDLSQVNVFRCWLRSDDGTTRTINTWRVGMLARCQTFNVNTGGGGEHSETYFENMNNSVTAPGNKLYWRAVTGVGEAKTKGNYSLENHILEDGMSHNYIDLSNDADMFLPGSDKPEALDHVVCYGDWKDRTLSNLISIETVGSEAPCIREMLDVGYTDGNSIDWSLINKERTRISPTAGNKFVAPSFVVTTEGSADESLYNERYKGVAFKTQFVQGQEISMAPDGSIVLLAYSDIETQNALKTMTIDPPSVANPAYGFIWVGNKARLGDAYVCQADGHRYVATQTGWEDRGLNDEARSTLKVDITGITSRVESAEASISSHASQITQKANSVDIVTLINNIVAAGLRIDSDEKKIQLRANKTEFLTSDGIPMIAVQMCNTQGEIDPVNGTIPSLVFYDGSIETGTARWVLNYLGLLQIVNSSTAQGWDFYTLEWLGSHSTASGMDRYQIIHSEAFKSPNVPYVSGAEQVPDENLEGNEKHSDIAYRYRSAFHYNSNDEKIYDPANGFFKENRFWESDDVDANTFLPTSSNEDCDGFFIIKAENDNAVFNIYNGQTDPDINGSQSHSPQAQITLDEAVQLGKIDANYQVGTNPQPSADIIQILDHYDRYILLYLWHGYVKGRYEFTVHYITHYNLTQGKLNFLLKTLDNGEWVRTSKIITPDGTEANWMDIDTIIAHQEQVVQSEEPNSGEEEPSYYNELGNWDE